MSSISSEESSLREQQVSIKSKIEELNAFKRRVLSEEPEAGSAGDPNRSSRVSSSIPQEIKTKYLESIQMLINRLSGYLVEIKHAVEKIEQINDLNEQIGELGLNLEEMNAQKEKKEEEINELIEQLAELNE